MCRASPLRVWSCSSLPYVKCIECLSCRKELRDLAISQGILTSGLPATQMQLAAGPCDTEELDPFARYAWDTLARGCGLWVAAPAVSTRTHVVQKRSLRLQGAAACYCDLAMFIRELLDSQLGELAEADSLFSDIHWEDNSNYAVGPA